MKNIILPIGSIVSVKGNDLMICSYIDNTKEVENDYYDYACCIYPVGVQENAILIKKSQIDKIKFIGYQDGKFSELKSELENNNG